MQFVQHETTCRKGRPLARACQAFQGSPPLRHPPFKNSHLFTWSHQARNEDSDSEDGSDAEGDDATGEAAEPAAPASKNKKRKADAEESAAKKKVKVANAKKAQLLAKDGEGGDEGKSKIWTAPSAGTMIGKKRRMKKK